MNNQFGKTFKAASYNSIQRRKNDCGRCPFTAPFKIMHPFYEKKDFMTVMLLMASAESWRVTGRKLISVSRECSNVEFVSQAYEKNPSNGRGLSQKACSSHSE